MAAPSPFPVYPLGYPPSVLERDAGGAYLVTGQVAGALAVHTGSDVPLSAGGRGSSRFHGTMDNTDVFFKVVSAIEAGSLSRTTPRAE